jgi:hypothetical protein
MWREALTLEQKTFDWFGQSKVMIARNEKD